MRKYEEALKSYDKAIGLNPKDAEAWLNKGVTLSAMGMYKEALESYDKAIELGGKYGEMARHNKSVTLSRMGKAG